MRRSYGRNRHASTAFRVVAHDSQDDVVSSGRRQSGLDSDRRPAEADAGTDLDGGYAELETEDYVGPGTRWETEWTRVAEVLDRFFFFLFMTLLLIPTVTILGVVRLFKPELSLDTPNVNNDQCI